MGVNYQEHIELERWKRLTECNFKTNTTYLLNFSFGMQPKRKSIYICLKPKFYVHIVKIQFLLRSRRKKSENTFNCLFEKLTKTGMCWHIQISANVHLQNTHIMSNSKKCEFTNLPHIGKFINFIKKWLN